MYFEGVGVHHLRHVATLGAYGPFGMLGAGCMSVCLLHWGPLPLDCPRDEVVPAVIVSGIPGYMHVSDVTFASVMTLLPSLPLCFEAGGSYKMWCLKCC